MHAAKTYKMFIDGIIGIAIIEQGPHALADMSTAPEWLKHTLFRTPHIATVERRTVNCGI